MLFGAWVCHEALLDLHGGGFVLPCCLPVRVQDCSPLLKWELVNTDPFVGGQPKFIFNTFAFREEILQTAIRIYPSICTHLIFFKLNWGPRV